MTLFNLDSAPPQLLRIEQFTGKTGREIELLICELWQEGIPTLVAGFTVNAAHSDFIQMIGIVQFFNRGERYVPHNHGWNYILNPSANDIDGIPEGPYYFDSRIPTETFFIPVLSPIFQAEIDVDVLRPEYSLTELQKIYNFVIPMFAQFESSQPHTT